MDKTDIKEKLIVLGVTSGIFLPARVIFSSLVSDHWLGSVGLVSAFAILLIVLVRKNYLGKFGEIFQRQMKKTIGGKSGKYVIMLTIIFAIYFGSSLYFMDRGDAIFSHDKEIFYEAIVNQEKFSIVDIPKEKLLGPGNNGVSEMGIIDGLDYALSISFSIMDDVSSGWLSHLVVVIFVEQLEIIGLLFFYRYTFRKKEILTK